MTVGRWAGVGPVGFGGIRELDDVLQRAMLLQERETITPNGLNLNQDDPATQRVVLIEVRFPFEREDCSLARVDQRLLEQAGEFCNGNISKVARLLGLSRGALRQRMQETLTRPRAAQAGAPLRGMWVLRRHKTQRNRQSARTMRNPTQSPGTSVESNSARDRLERS